MLTEVFETYGDIYGDILAKIYPAKNSTGFTERNLTVNFSKAYEKVSKQKNQNSFTWFEFQFGEENNLHIDAVIINETLHEMYIIESKRFSNPNPKMKEIGEDIERIHLFVNELRKECKADLENARIDMNNIKKCYGIILADVWLETSIKEEICEAYKDGTFLEKYKKKVNNQYELGNVQYFVNSMEKNERKRVHTYNLVSLCWEMKS